MSTETQTEQTSTFEPEQRSQHLRELRRKLSALALSAIAVFGVTQAASEQTPTFHGEQTVQIDNGDTVSDIANDEVEGGASNTGATVNKIVKMNPDVFQDGTPRIDNEDISETIEVPNAVKK